MLTLVVDTATPTVTAAVVRIPDPDPTAAATVEPQLVALHRDHGPRRHGEALAPAIRGVLAAAGAGSAGETEPAAVLAAVVVGVGPGPYTGLRVGMVTAAAFADAMGLPVHGVCSLDGLAVATAATPLLAITDARRRELYWALYGPGGRRLRGPEVATAAQLLAAVGGTGAHGAEGAGTEPVAAVAGDPSVAQPVARELGVPLLPPRAPDPVALAAAALPALRGGRAPLPLTPMYLRRPDAELPGPAKSVLAR